MTKTATPSEKSDTLCVDNVEEFSKKAIAKYNEKGMIVDAMLWSCIVPLLLEAGAKKRCPVTGCDNSCRE